MRKLTISTLLLSATLAASPSHAGWGSLLDDVKKTGADLLQQTSNSSVNTDISTDLNTNIGSTSLSSEALINGLREALAVGSERAIKQISAQGGYLNDSKIRVPLPAGLNKLAGALRQFGMGKQVEQFEQSINRAAERASAQATAILIDNIKNMSFDDALKIYQGSGDAATQYFREKSGPKIAALFKPVVDSALSEVGATRYYNDLALKAAKLPIVGKKINGDLTSHVTNAALDGLFLTLAAEEKLIRKDPASRTTALLKQLWNK